MMLKKLSKWRERRRCKRCKLRAVCLSMSRKDMGARIYRNPSYLDKAPHGCSAIEAYSKYRQGDNDQDVTYTGTAGSLRTKRSAEEVLNDLLDEVDNA